MAKVPDYRRWIAPPRETCEICGARSDTVQFQYVDVCSEACFHTKFWNEKVAWREAGDIVLDRHAAPTRSWPIRVEGKHYVADVPAGIQPRRSFMGFGGAVWYGVFFDGPHAGVLFQSNNVWHQGDIPESHRKRLPDNARFISKEEYDRRIELHRLLDVNPLESNS